MNKIRFTRVPQVIDNVTERVEGNVPTPRETKLAPTEKTNELDLKNANLEEFDNEFLDDQGEPVFSDLPDVIQDSTELTETERQIIKWQAEKAEYNAKRSAINSAIFIPALALGIGFSFLIGSSIPFFAGLLIGLAFMILGIILYVRASRSRYITQKGEKMLRLALIGVIINSLAIAGLIALILFSL